jgi:hypothetical protein
MIFWSFHGPTEPSGHAFLDAVKMLKNLFEIAPTKARDLAFPFFSELILTLNDQHVVGFCVRNDLEYQ